MYSKQVAGVEVPFGYGLPPAVAPLPKRAIGLISEPSIFWIFYWTVARACAENITLIHAIEKATMCLHFRFRHKADQLD